MGQIKQALKTGKALSLVAALTPMQQVFVREVVANACNQTEAAKRAGFGTPRQAAYVLSRTPHVQAAIRQERARMFDADLANVAAATLRSVMTDSEAPAAARVSAARTVLEVTRELGRRQDDQDADKQLHEMTPDELAGLIDKLDSERVKVARDITNTVELVN
jgi:phage terminase small subunit